MMPIIVKGQMSFEDYYKVNLYMIVRKRALWTFMIAFIISLTTLGITSSAKDNTFLYFTIAFVGYTFLIPLSMYFSAKTQYRKIPSMSEPKTYEFYTDMIKLNGVTVKMEMSWSNLTKVVQRKNDLLVFSTNNRSFFILPKSGFTSDTDIDSFKYLVGQNHIKNNFK